MKKSFKTDRLEKELQRVTNALFQGVITDPRLSGIDITRTKIAPDLSLLTIYFSNDEEHLTPEQTIELLVKSSGFIKKHIAGANIMRTIPQITFKYDNINTRVDSLDKIFRAIEAEKRNFDYYDDDSDNEYYQDEVLDDEELEYDDVVDEELDLDGYEDVEEDEE
jgi:ribosome-binding factor A